MPPNFARVNPDCGQEVARATFASKLSVIHRAAGAYAALGLAACPAYALPAPSGKTVAGVCHARGPNTKLPPQWIIYITVENVDKSIERCKVLGGKVIDGPRMSGDKLFCVIQDPAGAVAALVQA